MMRWCWPRLAGVVLALSAGYAIASGVPAGGPPTPGIVAGSMPASVTITQSILLGGRRLTYRVTAGSLPTFDEQGHPIGDVAYTAYIVPTQPEGTRPITFAVNGGPGASSGFLNLGAIGPKRLQFGAAGNAPSDPLAMTDNPATWLGFTDLVFIDPIGTGFSRSPLPMPAAIQHFYGVDQDVAYLSRFIYDWLKKSDRFASSKYLVGESYGGFRAPRIALNLMTFGGVAFKGLVLVSPALDADLMPITAPQQNVNSTDPMNWVVTLPSLAAAHYEESGQTLSSALMAPVERYARSQYVTDLLLGRDPGAVDRLTRQVAAYTGLPPSFVRSMGGRIDQGTFLREVYRDQGKIGDRYDIDVMTYDAFPWAKADITPGPVIRTFVRVGEGMSDFLTRVVGWRAPGQYHAYNPMVSAVFTGLDENKESATALRSVLAIDGRLRVLIADGYTDLSVPYFANELVVAQIPQMGPTPRLTFKVYPGGHMFYSRPESDAAFLQDVKTVYRIVP